jgi:hypothetical protein
MAFLEAMDRFLDAADIAATGHDNPWPRGLRIKRVSGTRGIWEMTWSFSSPDGRATFEFVHRDGEIRVLWRRIGHHGIYKNP